MDGILGEVKEVDDVQFEKLIARTGAQGLPDDVFAAVDAEHVSGHPSRLVVD